ncbi:hypothetical protein AYL99_02849 [Fonsecaea erecta]|uniref:Carboxylic ester hydrolase n=1 Tax=Fonsecaea erecta TaxID=1367422 RepID=A0A178ZV96_9EURO|nr:hypothetical protein AYL99_02849 [Fonsecaea erecta]OAP63622.1 hypothetical protein AYL99_02849 [Fonsecaea erecta]
MPSLATARHFKIAILGILLAVMGNVCTTAIATTNGTLQGGAGCYLQRKYFLGIPRKLLSAPFAAPESYNKTYDGVLDGSVQPPRYPQFGLAYVEDEKQSEDCIVVSVNYRVDPLGLVAYPAAGISGNYGIQGHFLALQWVRNELSSFGGDSNTVLLLGNSAGAWDSYATVPLAQAPSLMKSAAFQSGRGRGIVPVNHTKALNGQYIGSLNCSLDDGALDCLRKTPLTTMNKTLIAVDNSAQDVVGTGTLIQFNGSGNAWLPLVDSHIIPQNPASVGVRVLAIVDFMDEAWTVWPPPAVRPTTVFGPHGDQSS